MIAITTSNSISVKPRLRRMGGEPRQEESKPATRTPRGRQAHRGLPGPDARSLGATGPDGRGTEGRAGVSTSRVTPRATRIRTPTAPDPDAIGRSPIDEARGDREGLRSGADVASARRSG